MKQITFNRDGFIENRIGFNYEDLDENVKAKVIQEHYEFLIQTAQSEDETFNTDDVIENININGYLFDEDGDLLPIVTHVGKNNEVLKHTFGKHKYECSIIDYIPDYPIHDDIWPSRRWNKEGTEYIDISGDTPIKNKPKPTVANDKEDGGFTEGEWDISTHADNNDIVIRSPKGIIANLSVDAWDDIPKEETRANASLIAAAPAMYKALKDLIDVFKGAYATDKDRQTYDKAKVIINRIQQQ